MASRKQPKSIIIIMKKDETTFHVVVGNCIALPIACEYATEMLTYFDKNAKIEKSYIRDFERLITAVNACDKIVNKLINIPEIKELAKTESESLRDLIILCADLDIEKREKVIEFIGGLEND